MICPGTAGTERVKVTTEKKSESLPKSASHATGVAMSSCNAVEEAVLLSCDVPTRQYILHVDDEQQREHRAESFVIRRLDPTHLYVKVPTHA